MVAICQNNPRELTPAARRLPPFLDLDEICRKQDEEEEKTSQEKNNNQTDETNNQEVKNSESLG